MHIGALLTTLALAVGVATPTSADDRPKDPFGNHTVELTDGPLFGTWQILVDLVTTDKAEFRRCMEQSNSSCPEVSALMEMVHEARQYQGKALLGHLNRSINLMIKAAPGVWTGPLEVLKMRDGDCKSYSIAKYAAARAAGFSPDHVRGVIVHVPRRNVDHMVTVVYQDDRWLILDNLTNLLLEDSEQGGYEPLAVFDYKGARSYFPQF
jgi:predicted transglutaminase-like cysteine proteinase